jgi:hypothetical protein
LYGVSAIREETLHGTHLVRHASAAVAPDIVVVGVDVEVPFVHEIDALPEIVGRMAVEGVGHKGSLLQVGAGQEAEYELEQLGRKTPNLGCWSVELPQVQGTIAAGSGLAMQLTGEAASSSFVILAGCRSRTACGQRELVGRARKSDIGRLSLIWW